MCAAGSRDAVDSSLDHGTAGSRSVQRIARTIVAERVRGIVARNRTQRRRLLSTSSDVCTSHFSSVACLVFTLGLALFTCLKYARFSKFYCLHALTGGN